MASQLQLKEFDIVCIGGTPPRWPGPPRPKFPPSIVWRISEEGPLQVLVSQSKPVLEDLRVLETVRPASLHAAPAGGNKAEAKTTGYDHKPPKEPATPKFSRREALLIQSEALKIASRSLALQSAAVAEELAGLKDDGDEGHEY